MAQLSSEERQLFTDRNFVVLARTHKDGRPRAVTLWVDVDGDEIIVNGARSRAWIENLRRDPRVALAIFDLNEPYRRVSVQGTVTAIVDEGASEHYGRLTQKYRGLTEEEWR
ncbi:MAG TPA: TIGR03618 family F420-dependent PPOX class oxidoreductase [Dehalococcoidia bacterium]|nr:TIGR03618 family F420-dependent PPOX class oxidoreductase [Dehalococcoidia bacterium]